MSTTSGYNILANNIQYDIFPYYFFNYATIGTPANATLITLNNRKCWKFNNNTTFTPVFTTNTTINFVAVGGGQNSVGIGDKGGFGGGVVYGTFNISTSVPLTITIGAGGASTTIIGTNTNITALAGGGSGSTAGTNILTNTATVGGTGGAYGATSNGGPGVNGSYISGLGIYVAGGGGGSCQGSYTPGVGGLGGGGNGYKNGAISTTNSPNGTPGISNTGGGGGGGNIGGSGVVYFYL